MRILQLRFKNLNSLAGEWVIDLSHPNFLADGIFAITGPTGAGKSTILDAICLALYGRTPRLKNISKSSNEIMSRQTGECFSEVIFETHAGRFRCHWSQHRARKKAEGDLQSPKHEIADAISGKIIEAKIRGVAQQIEKATGMDFDRFTRSMLLAQGGFAAFLQADADQRAPILEQITGTEIYSHISIKVHERRVEETKVLALLNAELSGMQLLSEDQVQQLAANLTEKTHSDNVVNEALTNKNKAIAWLEAMANAEAELVKLNQQQQDLFIRQQAFQPELDKLERSKQALELSADYAGLNGLRNEQNNSQKTLSNSQQALPERNLQYTQTQEAFNTALSIVDLTKVEQKQTQIVIRKVRELDFQIQAKQKLIKSAQDTMSQFEQQLTGLRTQQGQENQQFDHHEFRQKEVTTLLASHHVNEGLIEQLASIEKQFQLLHERSKLSQQKGNELVEAEQKKTEIQKSWQTHSKLLQQYNDEFETLTKDLMQQKNELEQQLEQRLLNDWRQEFTSLTERQIQLEKIQTSVQLLDKFKQGLNDLTLQSVTLNRDVDDLDKKISEQNTQNHSLEREIDLLVTQQLLQKKIESYEDARQHLHDNEACPLCGSDDHPYAQGNIPELDDTINSLNAVKTTLKLNTEYVAQLRIKLAEKQKDQLQNSQQQSEIATNITHEESQLKQYQTSLSVEEELTESLLRQYLQDNNNKLTQVSNIVRDAENKEQQLTNSRQVVDIKRAELTELDRNLQAINHTQLMAEQTVERLAVEVATATRQLQSAQELTLAELTIYGVENLETESLDEILLTLTKRRDQWREWQRDKDRLEPLISSLRSQIQHRAEQITKTESELILQQQTLSVLTIELGGLGQERMSLFADKNPDTVETALINTIEQAEKNLDTVRVLSQSTEQDLHKLQHEIETLSKAIQIRSEQLTQAEQVFSQQLLKVGFSDEVVYQAACLNDEERQALQHQDQRLKTEATALMARLQDKTAFLANERTKQITEQPLELLKIDQVQLLSNLNVLKEEIGAVRQKLADNEEIRLKQKSRIDQIEAQQTECVRWNTLHELIGSADGKKYRNFAQGLTFEMMIGHANRQLQKMTDRYLLIRDEAQPLELNVVDNYQAGETRSTKNLSGGESFIVSLALALGLSQMASKNVRVDSLFLDEGFGTLDEEALDTALETLSGLQQEGKLIGVISHVQVLKERISTQIQISTSSGGRSTLSGPGISGPHL